MRSTAQGGTKLIRNGLQLYMDPFNINSYDRIGTSWFDLIENTAGTLTNITYSPSNSGTFILNGTNSYVIPPRDQWIPYDATEFTLSVFVKATGTNTSKYIIQQSSGYGNFGIGVGPAAYVTNNKYGFFILLDVNNGNDGPDNPFRSADGLTLAVNQWVNITGVYRKGIDIKTYQNGVLITTTAIPNFNLRTLYPGITTSIGCYDTSNPSYNFQGEMSTILIYNRALTDDEISDNFNMFRWRFGI